MSFDVEKKCKKPEPTEDTDGLHLSSARSQLLDAKIKLKEVVGRDFIKTEK